MNAQKWRKCLEHAFSDVLGGYSIRMAKWTCNTHIHVRKNKKALVNSTLINVYIEKSIKTPSSTSSVSLEGILRIFLYENIHIKGRGLLKLVGSPHEPKEVTHLDYFEKRYCPNCGALMIRKQIDYTIEVGDILDRSYGTTMPLPASDVYWECPNCSSNLPRFPPGPPPEFY